MTEVVSHQRFGFDTVFEDGLEPAPTFRMKRSYTPDEVEQIRRDAFSEGQTTGVAEAEQLFAASVSRIAAAAESALGALAQVAHDHRVCSAELALAAARKIADAALDQFPEAPVAAALAELAREIEARPRLMVRAGPERIKEIQTAFENAAQAIGFPGQIIVHADDALPSAAFQLDWGEGRAVFDPTASAARVAAALDAALASEGLHAEPLIPAPEDSNEADNG